MNIHANKTCFLNVGINEWYTTGSDRLKGSLINHGFKGDLLFWKNEWPDNKFPRECIYTVKAAAFNEAIKRGYRTMIWGDSSVTAVRNIDHFVAEINGKGYWLGQSGHNAAQTCSDACLAYFKVTRDEAERIHDCATGLFGVNIDFPQARKFIERFIQAGRDKAFHGSRFHAHQSKDPRFKFHRQDQSCATIIAAQEGMKLDPFQNHCAFAWDHYPHTFKIQGM